MNEVWKKVKGTKYYEVSNLGNVRSSFKKASLKPMITKDGYFYVGLYINRKRKYKNIHRLVAIEFIPNPENKPCVNHIDGNKQNNNVKNLEWCTYQENSRHSIDNGLQVNNKGENHNTAKLKELEAIEILNSEASIKEMTEKFNISKHTVIAIRGGRLWKHLKRPKNIKYKTSNWKNN